MAPAVAVNLDFPPMKCGTIIENDREYRIAILDYYRAVRQSTDCPLQCRESLVILVQDVYCPLLCKESFDIKRPNCIIAWSIVCNYLGLSTQCSLLSPYLFEVLQSEKLLRWGEVIQSFFQPCKVVPS